MIGWMVCPPSPATTRHVAEAVFCRFYKIDRVGRQGLETRDEPGGGDFGRGLTLGVEEVEFEGGKMLGFARV